MNKAEVLSMLSDGGTHRKQFSASSGVQKQKSSPTFSVPFDSGLCKHFHSGTGRSLTYNGRHDQYYCFLRTTTDIEEVEAWEARQGTLVFIRNLLKSTTALDTNFVDNKSGKKTEFGTLEEAAKYGHSDAAIEQLVKGSCSAISQISYLNSATHVCGIPAMAEKAFDLPRVLAATVSGRLRKEDWTSNLVLQNKEQSAKSCSVSEKWDAWQNATLTSSGARLDGKSIILLDDKYQSGLTMHFVASRLIALGAKEVHGLTMVKTLRDTDNLDVVER